MNTEKLRRPPKDALRTIKAGRLQGKSDINPQWRIDVMNEEFGLCGYGWYPTITKQWVEDGADGERMAFVNCEVHIRVNEEWSKPIPGTGGSRMISKEKSGLYNSDEAFKMAYTDALSVALKTIGVAADIYRGKFDGSKYEGEGDVKDTTPAPPPPKKNKLFPGLMKKAIKRISDGEVELYDKVMAEYDVEDWQIIQLKDALTLGEQAVIDKQQMKNGMFK
jgi:hypothetical protein